MVRRIVGTVVVMLVLAACGGGLSDFEAKIPKPEWFGSVAAPEVGSATEVSALWQSKERCCIDAAQLLANNREFYKSCYSGIVGHPDDEEMVVKCLWLMGAGAPSEQQIPIRQYLVDNYSHHRNSVADCVNCAPGDTVSRVTAELANLRFAKGDVEEAIRLIENVLDRRGGEVSLWVQTEIYASLGRMYLASSVTKTRKARMTAAYERLNRAKAVNPAVERRIERLEKVYVEVSARAAS